MKKFFNNALLASMFLFYMLTFAEATPIKYDQAPFSTVSQSSTVGGMNSPEKAVDGNIYTQSATQNETTTHAWWSANLGGVFEVFSIFIYRSNIVTPITFELQTGSNTTFSWSTEPDTSYAATFTLFLPAETFADTVSIKLQEYGVLQLNICKINVYPAVPEPATVLMFGTGLIAIGCVIIRRKKICC